MEARDRLMNWVIFVALSLIWGSSFILMKVGIKSLTAYQVAAIRILSAGIVLLPVAVKHIRQLPVKPIVLILLSGLLGSFFPAFLFCVAETRIDSALAGILNALTPLFTIVTGVLFFSSAIQWQKLTGVLTGFAGLCLLFISRGRPDFSYLSYAALVLAATVCYGLNVNLVSRHLKMVGSLNIAAFAFSLLVLPSFLILYFTGYFQLPLLQHALLVSTGASIVLGVMGTAVASILFYVLVKRAGVLFPSMVTYGIPFVAILWGVVYDEGISLKEIGCLGIILTGVVIANK